MALLSLRLGGHTWPSPVPPHEGAKPPSSPCVGGNPTHRTPTNPTNHRNPRGRPQSHPIRDAPGGPPVPPRKPPRHQSIELIEEDHASDSARSPGWDVPFGVSPVVFPCKQGWTCLQSNHRYCSDSMRRTKQESRWITSHLDATRRGC